MSREDGIGYCGTCGRKATWVTLDGYGGCEVHGRGPLNWTRPYPTTDVRDANGVRIAKGQRVAPIGDVAGTIVDVTAPAADYDDTAERDVALWPRVVVEYDDGIVESWRAVNFDRHGDLDHYVCDDVEIEEGA